MAARNVADISDVADEIIEEVKNFYSISGLSRPIMYTNCLLHNIDIAASSRVVVAGSPTTILSSTAISLNLHMNELQSLSGLPALPWLLHLTTLNLLVFAYICMYVCMYVCMYIFMRSMYVCTMFLVCAYYMSICIDADFNDTIIQYMYVSACIGALISLPVPIYPSCLCSRACVILISRETVWSP